MPRSIAFASSTNSTASEPCRTACCAHSSPPEAGSWPSPAGRREVPDSQAQEGIAGTPLPVHGIDDAIRVRALKTYKRQTQANAIDFIDYVVEKFPFRIRTIRTDRGGEFQALFHWHVADLGMEHVYIEPRTPQLNGKVERSHRTDKDEFYQLLTYRDDVALEKKLAVWERFYNFNRPYGTHGGKTPYEALGEKFS